jgi:glucose/mannose-6-phosphate isomerase
VIDLDDVAALRAADPGGMLDAVLALPEQCRAGYAVGCATTELPVADDVTAVAFCGMGGSGIAGDVIRTLYAGRLHVPVTVVRTPELPAFCGPHTLTLVSSYSGDTAETLELFEEAVHRGCRVIAITSGGLLAARTHELATGCVRAPAGYVPRAAFGFLVLGALGALEAVGLVPRLNDDLDEAVTELREIASRGGPEAPSETNPWKALALELEDRIPVVWGADGFAAVAALRWKTQLNENAKVPAFASVLPELDHNEVEGWSAHRGAAFALIALRHEGEHPDVAARFPPSIEIARSSGATVHEVWARGGTALARLLTLVLVGDLVSTYLAAVRGVDPSPMEAIASVKRTMAESSRSAAVDRPDEVSDRSASSARGA